MKTNQFLLGMMAVESLRQITLTTASIREQLVDVSMVESFKQVALEHNLSAPLVAAFHASPRFDNVVANFPKTDQFDVVPEQKATPNNQLGLEAFDAAETAVVASNKDQLSALVVTFESSLGAVSAVLVGLKDDVLASKIALEASDIADDVLAGMEAFTLNDEQFVALFTNLDQALSSVGEYTAEELRAKPEALVLERQGLEAFAAAFGDTLNLKVDAYGLRDGDGGSAFATMGTFENKQLTKAGLIHILARTESVLDQLISITDRKDALVQALNAEVEASPAALESNSEQFGYTDHAALMMSYVTLTGALLRTSLNATHLALAASAATVVPESAFEAFAPENIMAEADAGLKELDAASTDNV